MKRPIIHLSILKEAQDKARIHSRRTFNFVQFKHDTFKNVGANISDSCYVHISAQNLRNEEGEIL